MRYLMVATAFALPLCLGCGTPETPKGSVQAANTDKTNIAPAKSEYAYKAEIKGAYMCCASCERCIRSALAAVKNVDHLNVNVKERVITFGVKDRQAADAALEALRQGGLSGTLQTNAPTESFVTVGNWLGGPDPNLEVAAVNKVHCCCAGCEKAIKEVFKGHTVTFEGDGCQKTVRVKGSKLSPGAVANELMTAGFYGFP